MPSYREARRLYVQVELDRTKTGLYVLRGEVVAVIGAGLLALVRRGLHQPIVDRAALLSATVAACTPMVYYLGAYTFFRIKASKKLYEASRAALADSEMALAASRREHAAEVRAVQRECSAKVTDCENQKAAALSEAVARYSEMESHYRAARAQVTTRIIEDGNRLLLLVENSGSVSACISARLLIEGALSARLPTDAYCRWDGGSSWQKDATIRAGDFRYLFLAERRTRASTLVSKWYVPYTTSGGDAAEVESQGSNWPGAPAGCVVPPKLKLIVEIISDPQLLEAARRLVRLEGVSFMDITTPNAPTDAIG